MSERSVSPWRREKWDIVASDNSRVATIHPWDVSGCKKEDQDNANLISAAPELLDACIQLVWSADKFWDGRFRNEDDEELANAIINAQTAIAKAKGI